MKQIKLKDLLNEGAPEDGEHGGSKKFSTEAKKNFLEIVSTYNKYQEMMDRKSDITKIAETLGAITEAATELAVNEADDWFDKHTVKRNMGDLKKMGVQFNKVAKESAALDQRMTGLYEDMGHILSRYYKIGEITEDEMKSRLGMRNESVITKGTRIKVSGTIFGMDNWRPKNEKGIIKRGMKGVVVKTLDDGRVGQEMMVKLDGINKPIKMSRYELKIESRVNEKYDGPMAIRHDGKKLKVGEKIKAVDEKGKSTLVKIVKYSGDGIYIVTPIKESKVNEAELSLKSNPKLYNKVVAKLKKQKYNRDADYHLTLLKSMNPKKLSQSDLDTLNDFDDLYESKK